MPPTDGDKAFRWRLEDSYRTVTGEAFAKLVHENGLEPKGPFQGYWYAMKHTTEGEELYRTLSGHKWVYQARRVVTQDNAGGGALVIRIYPGATGQICALSQMYAKGPASNTTLNITVQDEDGAVTATVASNAAATNSAALLPSIGTSATASGNVTNSQNLIIPPGGNISVVAAAALQTETLTVGIVFDLINVPDIPIWATTGSGGTPTLAASSISEANTLTEVLV